MRQQSKLLLVIYVVGTIDIIACGILYAATTNIIALNYIAATINKLLLVIYIMATINIIDDSNLLMYLLIYNSLGNYILSILINFLHLHVLVTYRFTFRLIYSSTFSLFSVYRLYLLYHTKYYPITLG